MGEGTNAQARLATAEEALVKRANVEKENKTMVRSVRLYSCMYSSN